MILLLLLAQMEHEGLIIAELELNSKNSRSKESTKLLTYGLTNYDRSLVLFIFINLHIQLA